MQRIADQYGYETLNNISICDKEINFIAKDCMTRGIEEKYISELEDSPFLFLDCGNEKLGKSFLGLSIHYFQSQD